MTVNSPPCHHHQNQYLLYPSLYPIQSLHLTEVEDDPLPLTIIYYCILDLFGTSLIYVSPKRPELLNNHGPKSGLDLPQPLQHHE